MSEATGARDVAASLAAKLDALGAGLPDEERALLAAVISAGVKDAGPEVSGYAGSGDPVGDHLVSIFGGVLGTPPPEAARGPLLELYIERIKSQK